MIPILFRNKSEREFKTGGVLLATATYCHVKWTREGVFEAEIHCQYNPYLNIEVEQWVLVKAYDEEKLQPFFIYDIVQKINGEIYILCRHASYLLSNIPFSSIANYNNIRYLNTFLTIPSYEDGTAIGPTNNNPYAFFVKDKFNFILDPNSNFEVKVFADQVELSIPPINLRQTLFDDSNPTTVTEKVVLEKKKEEITYDAYKTIKGACKLIDFRFDGFDVYYNAPLKYELGDNIIYGINMSEFDRSIELSDYYDGILPYYNKKYSSTEYKARYQPILLDVSDYVADTNKPINHKYLTIDISDEFTPSSSKRYPTQEKAEELARAKFAKMYREGDYVWAPKEKVSVSFVPGTVAAYPFNFVGVHHKLYNFHKKGRIVAIEYDSIQEIALSATISDFEEIVKKNNQEADDDD